MPNKQCVLDNDACAPDNWFYSITQSFLLQIHKVLAGCAFQAPHEARSKVGAHLSKLRPYTGNWTKSRGWALIHEWPLFRETMVYGPCRLNHTTLKLCHSTWKDQRHWCANICHMALHARAFQCHMRIVIHQHLIRYWHWESLGMPAFSQTITFLEKK